MTDTLDPALEELGSTVLALPVRFREALAQWMMTNSFATGHGDTFADLLTELTWQVAELRQRASPQPEIDRLREALRMCKERLRALDQGRSIHNSRFPDKAIEDGGLWDMGDIMRQAEAALHPETPNGGQNA